MKDFYRENHSKYFERTFNIDPSSFISPLATKLAPGSFILDIGCGSGRDLLWLKNRGFQVMGFERSPGLAELARKSAGCDVLEGDFTSYDFSSIRADAVILIGALVHIPHADFAAVLLNIAAALKENGLMLITVKEGTGNSRRRGRTDLLSFPASRSGELSLLLSAFSFSVSRGISPKPEPVKPGSGTCFKKNEPAGPPAPFSSFLEVPALS